MAGIKVTALGFGAAPLGNLYREMTDAGAAEVAAAAFGAGIAYVDTAPHYGFGLCETRLGSALRQLDPTEEIIVSTKVGRLLAPLADGGTTRQRHGFVAAPPFEPVFDYSYDGVMRSFESSRRRLGRERIDILLAHDLGRATHGDEHARLFATFMGGGYRAMRELRDGGIVGAIGIGANECAVCAEAMRAADFDVFLIAGRYTLLEQDALEDFLPACTERQISIIIGAPYNSGILAQGTRGVPPLRYNYEAAPAAIIDRVRRIEAICERYGVPIAAAALQFPLAHRQVACVIPGMGSTDEVATTLDLFTREVPASLWDELKHEALLRGDAPVPAGRMR